MKKLITKKHIGPLLDKVDNYDVIDCLSCKFIHIFPIPTEKELAKLYTDQFYSHEKPQYFSDAEEDFEWWMLTYENYYRIFEKNTKGRKILDIGSGPGYFLKCGADRGWKVLGFEPSKQAYDYSKKLGVSVVNDFYTAKKIEKYGKFDVVFLSLVLEHLPDPISLLQEVKKALKLNGILCILSPNDYNPLQKILKDDLGFKPWWVVPLQHINYFNFKSVKSFLKRGGFKIKDLYGTFPMEYFLLSGDNYVGNSTLGRQMHRKRKEFEINLHRNNPKLLNSLYSQFAKVSIGREFIILATPKNAS